MKLIVVCTLLGVPWQAWAWAGPKESSRGSLPSKGELPPSHPVHSVDLAQFQWDDILF